MSADERSSDPEDPVTWDDVDRAVGQMKQVIDLQAEEIKLLRSSLKMKEETNDQQESTIELLNRRVREKAELIELLRKRLDSQEDAQ